MPIINVVGQYWIDKNSKTEICNFEFKNKEIPACKKEEINCFFEGRYFPQWFKGDKSNYFGSKPVLANYRIEIVDEKKHAKSCLGKDILKMSMEELQDFATECGLIDVPVINQSGMNLKRAREKAAFVYLRDVEGLEELQDYSFDNWLQRQRNPETEKLENPFEEEGLEVVISKLKRFSLKKNKIINKIQSLNRMKEFDFGETTDLSTRLKPKKPDGLGQEKIIE